MKTYAGRLAIGAYAAALAFVLATVPAQADEGWIINSFHSNIQIGADSTLTVTEDIRVDFGSLQKHGIFRTIPTRERYDTTHNRVFDMSVISVTDGSRPIPETISGDGNNTVIKIVNSTQLVSGPQRYVITYKYGGVMNAFSDHDELYWNVDGGAWPVAKKSVSATVVMPAGSFMQAACYQGPRGSRETCSVAGHDNTFTYTATRPLGSGEQMSIVTGLVKGAVSVPAPLFVARQRNFPQEAFDINPSTVGVSALILIAGLALIARFWWVHGRDRAHLTQYYLTNDPRDHPEPLFQHDPVVVEFGPPQNLRPAELGLVLDESADTKDVTATIVDLAVRGVLTITEVPGEKDWALAWRPNQVPEVLPFERTLLDGLFTGRQEVKLSELKGTFQPRLRSAEDQMYSDAMARKFFTTRPDYIKGGRILLGVVLLGACIWLAKWLGTEFGWGLVGVAVGLVGLTLIATYRLMSVRTAAGRDLMQHTLGFRLYMNTAEKYRQQFAEKAEIFTQLLPYAIVSVASPGGQRLSRASTPV